jgi:hypothetical protein
LWVNFINDFVKNRNQSRWKIIIKLIKLLIRIKVKVRESGLIAELIIRWKWMKKKNYIWFVKWIERSWEKKPTKQSRGK